MQLTIDTTAEVASLAIIKEGKVLAESAWQCGQSHTVQLLPRLVQMLDQAGLTLQSITGIIVARGPGSFNGLRVGISTAKGLALRLVVPVVGISSLEVEAYHHAETGLPICPIFGAGREEIATAMYQMNGNGWHQLVAEHITTVDNLCLQITTKTIFCGEFIPFVATQLRRQLKRRAVILPSDVGLRRAAFLAKLGLKQLEAGSYDSPSTLQPLYLRRPPITKPKHR